MILRVYRSWRQAVKVVSNLGGIITPIVQLLFFVFAQRAIDDRSDLLSVIDFFFPDRPEIGRGGSRAIFDLMRLSGN